MGPPLRNSHQVLLPLGLAVALLALAFSGVSATDQDETSSYVVYMGGPQSLVGLDDLGSTVLSSHLHILDTASSSLGINFQHSSLLYSYKTVFNGFAAKLTRAQVEALSAMPEVVSVFPNRPNKLHTTRTWEFLGVANRDDPQSGALWQLAEYGQDIIVGMLDTGIWPESESFNDAGYSKVPGTWKGSCVESDLFGPQYCNNKLIGGKYYIKGYEAALGPINLTRTPDYRSARDGAGHGTHTSSTAAGSFVPGASVLGFAGGTARGGAPRARLAMYKVCWPIVPAPGSLQDDTCYDADILAALDEALADGVHLLSLSIGGGGPVPYNDGIATGAFHAVARGVPVVASAGNEGPAPGSVENASPWLFTVAASSLDRAFPSDAVLGNGAVYKGVSLSVDKLQEGTQYPLVLASQVGAATASPNDSVLCLPGSLDPAKTAGKIVACLRGLNARLQKGQVVKDAGGVGMILGNAPANGDELLSDPHILPATHITAESMTAVQAYIASTSSPTATLTPATTTLHSKPAPVMASFSSQGPNLLFPEILKPDITAPGSNVLAAWTNATGVAPGDSRRVAYNVLSGTSMSCPHVAGIVALLRSVHPRWSPAAIKSAIMTTASQLDNTGHGILNGSLVPAGPYNFGAGHVHPNAAVDPGLVYDTSAQDYITFLCGQNYTSAQVSTITGTAVQCPASAAGFRARDLNYPSLSVANLSGTVSVTRTVTNVGGKAGGTYRAEVVPPAGVNVTLVPDVLVFDKKDQALSFNVTVTKVQRLPANGYAHGYYAWVSESYYVRSPIVVTFS